MATRIEAGEGARQADRTPGVGASTERVSLSYVLADLEQAIDGIARLLEGVEAYHYEEAEVRVVCRSAVSLLSLAAARLHATCEAIATGDPGPLHSRHTAALPPDAAPEKTPDVVLRTTRSHPAPRMARQVNGKRRRGRTGCP